MSEIRELLSACSVGTRLKLTGPLIVARDIAHAKIKERLDAGEEMPRYMKDHAVYYAGPAKTPDGMASGSFGPTTAGRMDSYVDAFQAAGGSMVMLAKGNRSAQVTRACKKHGGFYLGSIGGPAAILAQNNIKKVDVLEFPELGMEAIWKIEVEDFPAFVIGTTRATTSSRSGRPEGTRVRVTLVAKLFLGYRLRTTREANKSPSDVSRCASAAGIADLGVSSPAASSKREDARVICPPPPQSRTSVTTVPSLPMAAASRAMEASTAARWVSSTFHTADLYWAFALALNARVPEKSKKCARCVS